VTRNPEAVLGSRINRLPRRWRRPIAAATLLGLPGMYAWSSFWQSTTVPTIAWGPVTFLLIGATVAGSFVMYAFVRHRADMPGADLDERQRELRDRAWILSYQVLSAVVVVGVATIALLVLAFDRTVVVDATLATAGALSIGVLIPVLPVAALAWIEPDPPEES